MTWSGAQLRCGIGIWSSTGLESEDANATDAALNSTGNSADLDVDVATLDGGFIIVYGWHNNNASPSGSITYSPAAIEHRFFTTVESTAVHYGGSGETDGSTFDVRTVTTIGTTNTNSPLVAASF